MKKPSRIRLPGLVFATALALLGPGAASGADRAQLTREAAAALESICKSDTSARLLREKAKAVLVCPHIVKAGFLFGGQIGDGVLFKGGKASGEYNSTAASYGLQAGIQTFGYALFFMNDEALAYVDKTDGWEIGVGPSIVVVDKGVGKSMTSAMLTEDVYAFIFDQKGLMAGIGIQGSKITKISPNK
jgi:lipid-binding SYLF domain-containing protein